MSKEFISFSDAQIKLANSPVSASKEFVNKVQLMAMGAVPEPLEKYSDNDFVCDEDVSKSICAVKPIFLIDFANEINNETQITEQINNFKLFTQSQSNTISIVSKDGFRCMSVSSASSDNVYKIPWDTIRGKFESTLKTGNFTFVEFFAASSSPKRWSSAGFINTSQLLGWGTDNGNRWCNIVNPQIGIGHMRFNPGDTVLSVGMCFFGLDRSSKVIYHSAANNDTGFLLSQREYLSELDFNGLGAISNTTEFVIGKAQESEYYMQPGAHFAGLAIYDKLLSEEELRQIYTKKKFMF